MKEVPMVDHMKTMVTVPKEVLAGVFATGSFDAHSLVAVRIELRCF
jgi:hypothetical protein